MIVNLTGETADIVVPDVELAEAQRAQIEDIVKRKTGIAAENIVITPYNESAEDGWRETAGESTGETTEKTVAETIEDTP